MTPRKLLLRRVCQHYEKEIVFADGMNSIVGANGSGKSNILHALCLVLGLDTNLKGKKTDMIQDGYDKAEVILEFVHRDIPGQIKVTLKRNYIRNWDEQSLLIDQARNEVHLQQENPAHKVDESTLKLATFTPKETTGFVMEWGEVKCRNGTELSDWMRREVGVEPKMIVSTYFPSQGDIDGALSADKAERQAVFSAKAGTAMCEILWSMLGKELTGLEDFTGVEDRHAQAKAAVAICTAKAKELREQFAAVEALDRNAEQHNDVLRRFSKARDDLQKLGSLNEELAKATSLRDEADKHVQGLIVVGKDLREKADNSRIKREEAMQLLAKAEAVGNREAQRKKLWADLASAKEQLQTTLSAVPQEPPSDSTLADLAGQIAQYEGEVKRVSEYLRVFKTGKCPTCGTAVAAPEKIQELEGSLKASQQALAEQGPKRVNLESTRKQLLAAKSFWESKVASLRGKIAQVESTLAAMPPQEATATPEELERARNYVAESARLDGELQQTRAAYESGWRVYERAKATAEALTKQIYDLQVALQSAPNQDAYQAALTALTKAQEAQTQYNDLKVQLGIAEARLTDAKTQLADAEATLARVGPQRTWKAMVEQARDLLHRDSLPSEVVAWYATSLVSHTMNYLKLFEVNFSVIVTPDLGLMAIFPDKAMPVAKLSGGEKNMLNISMRLAMADLFPSDLRVLVLDEVEVHLDQTNVAKLPMLLEKVKCLARNRGLVVLFVSHHPSLRDIADNIVYSRDAA